MSNDTNCTTFDVYVWETYSLEDEVFETTHCISTKMRAIFVYFWMFLSICNILFSFLVIYVNFKKSRIFNLNKFTLFLCLLCAIGRLAYFCLIIREDHAFILYFLIFAPGIVLMFTIGMICFNWIRVVSHVSSFFQTKDPKVYLIKVLVTICVLIFLMFLMIASLVYPAYLQRGNPSEHNLLMAGAVFVINVFQFGGVLFMFSTGGRLMKLIETEENPEIVQARQRIAAFRIRILFFSTLVFAVSLVFLLWAASTANTVVGMEYCYFLVQLWWAGEILGVFAVLYSSYQKRKEFTPEELQEREERKIRQQKERELQLQKQIEDKNKRAVIVHAGGSSKELEVEKIDKLDKKGKRRSKTGDGLDEGVKRELSKESAKLKINHTLKEMDTFVASL